MTTTEKSPRVLPADFFGTLVVWDAALDGTLTHVELVGGWGLYEGWNRDPKNQNERATLDGLVTFGRERATRLPISDADHAEVKRVFSLLPFGPMDQVGRQMLFVLWLWSRFAREGAITKASIAALRAQLLGQVNAIVNMPERLARAATKHASELLALETVLARFEAFLGAPPSSPWGLRLARGLARAALGGITPAPAITPDELVAALWCSFRLDERSVDDVRAAAAAA